MSVWTDNAAAFATKPADAIDARRHAGVREAIALLKAGKPGEAQYQLIESVRSQARMAGLTGAVIPLCPCGEGCTHVVAGGAS